MAFIPTKKDFEDISENKSGFIPSVEDLEENPSASRLESSFLPTGKASPYSNKNLLISLAQEAANIPQGIMNIPSFLTGGMIENPMEQGYEIPGLGPNPFAGEVKIPGYEEIKETPEAYLASAIPYVLPAYGAGRVGLKALKPVSEFLSGKKSIRTAEEFIKSLTGNNKISEINEGINKRLVNNFSKVEKTENTLWKNAEDIADKENFHGEPSGLSKALGARAEYKSIETPKSLDKIDKLKIHDTELEERINAFRERPSFKNAHALQSRLGQQASDLYRSADSADHSLAHQYTKARESFINEMKSSVRKHGSENLVKAMEAASDFTKNNVVPYTKNRTINSIVTKKGLEQVEPENIHNILSKGDASIRRVVKDLSPEDKNLILAAHLKRAVTHSEKKGQTVDVEKLLSSLNKVKNSSAEKFLTPEHREIIKNIEKQSKFSPKIAKATKTVGGITLGVLGLERLNSLLRNLGVY